MVELSHCITCYDGNITLVLFLSSKTSVFDALKFFFFLLFFGLLHLHSLTKFICKMFFKSFVMKHLLVTVTFGAR